MSALPLHGEDQLDLIALDHIPIQPARKDHMEEQVFAAMWKAAMALGEDASHNVLCDDVLEHFTKPITQRHASVVASVVVWLGSSIGSCLLAQADRWRQLNGGLIDHDHAYLIAWTIENQRRRWLNCGVRTAEYLLSPASAYRRSGGLADSGLKELPELSADDLEVIEHLMLWLAKPTGQRFLARCNAKIEGSRHEARLLRLADCELAQAAAQ